MEDNNLLIFFKIKLVISSMVWEEFYLFYITLLLPSFSIFRNREPNVLPNPILFCPFLYSFKKNKDAYKDFQYA